MEEEKKLDPRDLDGDGKVTFEEKVKYAAAQAGKKISEVAAGAKEGAQKLYDKAAPKAKSAFEDVKGKISNLTGKKEEPKGEEQA